METKEVITKLPDKADDSRDYFFDNLRILLIFLVVLCHGIETARDTSEIIVRFHESILLFVMPMFMFVTGYFAKGMAKADNPKRVKILNILLLFIICQVIKCLIYGYDDYLKPHYGNWYMLAMVIYYTILPSVSKIKPAYMLGATVLFATYIGVQGNINGFFQFSRLACFLPFFLLGFYFKKEWAEIIKTKKARVIGIFLVVIGVTVYQLLLIDIVPTYILHANKSYPEMGLTFMQGACMRLGWYVYAVMMCFAVCAFIPRKKVFFSYLGTRTLPVYILHTIIFSIIIEKTTLFEMMAEMPYTLFVFIIFSLVVTLLCAHKWCDKLLGLVMNFSFDFLLIDKKQKTDEGK